MGQQKRKVEMITHASTRLWREVLCGASKPIDGPLISTGSKQYVTCEDCKQLLPLNDGDTKDYRRGV